VFIVGDFLWVTAGPVSVSQFQYIRNDERRPARRSGGWEIPCGQKQVAKIAPCISSSGGNGLLLRAINAALGGPATSGTTGERGTYRGSARWTMVQRNVCFPFGFHFADAEQLAA
jgi:hypothetical protein